MRSFDLQGHRGARGLRPENTLPSFEAALDVGVTSIETDVHLTRDGVPVLIHDPRLSDVEGSPLISGLTLSDLRTLVAADALPTLEDLFRFLDIYATKSGKNPAQQAKAKNVRIDLELKRVPFRPENIGDDFDGVHPGLLERRAVDAVQAAGMAERVSVRSFDHRSLRAVRALAPDLATGLLIAGTAPLTPGRLAREAGCSSYCPEFEFLDESQIREAQAAGVRVLPWTVNDPADWERLLDWGVDGVTTDYPDRLAAWLQARGIPF